VRNGAGENIGKIEDVIINPETGDIEFGILSFGGVLGLGKELHPIPWSMLNISPTRDYVLLDIDPETLKRAPGFERGNWTNMTDPAWRRSIYDYYGLGQPVVRDRPVLRERPVAVREQPVVVKEQPVVVERRIERARPGMSLIAGILIVCLVLGLAWVTFLVSTRGWDQAREDIKSSVESAAYAAKETSQDAALTTKVKTALSLSKRIPASLINVDSEGDVVTLRGEVPSDQVRELAESIARDVPGVAEVHNHLFAVNRSQ
jgi:sporulation protein YlmC with PRC-barrel domain